MKEEEKQMTVRDFIQTLLLEAPDLDADIYILKQKDEIEVYSYDIKFISSHGSNDSLFIELEDQKLK